MKINELIRTKRRDLNLTQQELADILYLSPKTISKWETGRGLPEFSIIPKLAETLKISPEELMGSISDTTSENDPVKTNLQLTNTLWMSGALFLAGQVSFFIAVFSNGYFLYLSLFLYITAIALYFILENHYTIKNLTTSAAINKTRKTIFTLWYLVLMSMPLYLFMVLLTSDNLVDPIPMILMAFFETLAYVLVMRFAIKR